MRQKLVPKDAKIWIGTHCFDHIVKWIESVYLFGLNLRRSQIHWHCNGYMADCSVVHQAETVVKRSWIVLWWHKGATNPWGIILPGLSMQPTIPSIFQFASCEGRNHRRPSIGEQQGQDRKKRISHSHWLMELQSQGWLPLLSQQPSNRAVGIVAQPPVFGGLCLKSIRPSKVGDPKTSQCTCGQEHGPPIFLAPPQTGRSQRKGLMGTTTRRARSAGQQCNGGERRRSSFLSRYGLILAQSHADRNGNLFSAPSKSQPSSRLMSPGSPYAAAPMIWQSPQNEKLLKPGCSMTPAPLRRVSASPSKASSGGMQDVHKQRFAPMAENKIPTTPCRSFASSLQDYTPCQGTQRERTKPSSRAPPTLRILRSRGVPSGQSPVLSVKTISVHPKYTRERAHTLSINEPSAPIVSNPPLLSHSPYPGQGNPGDRTPSPLNVKTYYHWQFPSPLTPLASPSIALSSQQGVSCTLFLNKIALRIVQSSGIILTHA